MALFFLVEGIHPVNKLLLNAPWAISCHYSFHIIFSCPFVCASQTWIQQLKGGTILRNGLVFILWQWFIHESNLELILIVFFFIKKNKKLKLFSVNDQRLIPFLNIKITQVILFFFKGTQVIVYELYVGRVSLTFYPLGQQQWDKKACL